MVSCGLSENGFGGDRRDLLVMVAVHHAIKASELRLADPIVELTSFIRPLIVASTTGMVDLSWPLMVESTFRKIDVWTRPFTVESTPREDQPRISDSPPPPSLPTTPPPFVHRFLFSFFSLHIIKFHWSVDTGCPYHEKFESIN
jgi:hypothetical protein